MQQNVLPASIFGTSMLPESRITFHMGDPLRITGSGIRVPKFSLGLNSDYVIFHYLLSSLETSVSTSIKYE